MAPNHNTPSTKRSKPNLLVNTKAHPVPAGNGSSMPTPPATNSDSKVPASKVSQVTQQSTESGLPTPPMDKQHVVSPKPKNPIETPDITKGFTADFSDIMTPEEWKAFDELVYGPQGAPDSPPCYDDGADIDYEMGFLH